MDNPKLQEVAMMEVYAALQHVVFFIVRWNTGMIAMNLDRHSKKS